MTEADVAELARSLGLDEVETRMIAHVGIAEVSWRQGGCIAILRATDGRWEAVAEALTPPTRRGVADGGG
jgi:hypothetical protein